MLGFIGGLGSQEILIIVLIALLLFGAKKLPDIFRGMGEGIREFHKARREIVEEIETASRPEPRSQPKRAPTAGTEERAAEDWEKVTK